MYASELQTVVCKFIAGQGKTYIALLIAKKYSAEGKAVTIVVLDERLQK